MTTHVTSYPVHVMNWVFGFVHFSYNAGSKAEKVNAHLNKIQEKLVKDETYSSCLSSIVVFRKPVKKRVSSEMADLRRSPRKKAVSARYDQTEQGFSSKRQRYFSKRGPWFSLPSIHHTFYDCLLQLVIPWDHCLSSVPLFFFRTSIGHFSQSIAFEKDEGSARRFSLPGGGSRKRKRVCKLNIS